MKPIIFKSHTSILTVCFLFETALQSQLALNLLYRYNKHKLLTNQVLTLGALSQEAGLVESYLGIEFHPVRV